MLQTALFMIAGLVCALVAILVLHKANGNIGPHWALGLLIVVVFGNVAWFSDGWIRQKAIDDKSRELISFIDQNPVILAMKSTSPSQYGKLVKAIHDSGEAPEDERRDRVATLSEPIIRSFVRERILNMSDDTAVGYGLSLSKMMLSLSDSNPDNCQTLILSMKDKKDLPGASGDDEMTEMLRDVLYSAPVTAPEVMDAVEAKGLLILYVGYAVTNLGLDASQRPSQKQFCQVVGTALQSAMQTMQKRNAASMIRSIVRSGVNDVV